MTKMRHWIIFGMLFIALIANGYLVRTYQMGDKIPIEYVLTVTSPLMLWVMVSILLDGTIRRFIRRFEIPSKKKVNQ